MFTQIYTAFFILLVSAVSLHRYLEDRERPEEQRDTIIGWLALNIFLLPLYLRVFNLA